MNQPQQATAPGSGVLSQTSAVDPRHSAWTIALHWTSVLAIVVSSCAGLLREVVEDSGMRVVLLDIHRQVGLFVLVALLLRLIARFSVGMADHSDGSPMIQRCMAQGAHCALYLLLFAMPVLGLAVSNAHAVQVKLFGLSALPNLVGEDSDLADKLTDYHVWGAWLLLGLVVAHVAAACWHHWVQRDGVLVAMLPGLKRKQ